MLNVVVDASGIAAFGDRSQDVAYGGSFQI